MTSKVNFILPIDVCEHNCILLQTKRARCGLKRICFAQQEKIQEIAVIELVYKFDEKSTVSGRKRE